jgi:LppX_LprAFG lipoprotein
MTLRRAAAAASVAALLVISGCGSASDTSSSEETSETTSESTEPTGGTEPSGPPTGELTLANFAWATSEAQVQAQSVHVEAQGDMQGQTFTMSGDMAVGQKPDDTAFSITLSLPTFGDDLSMILVDGMMYVPEGQGSDKYLEIDLNDPSNPMGALLGQVFRQADPVAMTRSLEGAIDDLRAVGSEQIDGVATTHYTVTVDARKVLAKTMGEDLMSLQQESGTGLPAKLTYDIWVGDEDKLPRRIEFDMMSTSMVMDFTNWGEPVDIQAPPDSQISDQDPFASMPTPTQVP